MLGVCCLGTILVGELQTLISYLPLAYKVLVSDKPIGELLFIIFLVPSIVYLAAECRVKVIFMKQFCVLLGGLSYPMYLFHYPVQLFMANVLGVHDVLSYTTLLVYLTIVILSSFSYYRWIDPAIMKMRSYVA